jgi:hypothetical protein
MTYCLSLLIDKISISLLYCEKIIVRSHVDVKRFVFYCNLLMVLILLDTYAILINQESWNVSWLHKTYMLIHIYLLISRLWHQQYFISAWHISSWNVSTRRTLWNYSLHSNQWRNKILSKVCFGSNSRLVLWM